MRASGDVGETPTRRATANSSVGQSAPLIRVRSLVQIQVGGLGCSLDGLKHPTDNREIVGSNPTSPIGYLNRMKYVMLCGGCGADVGKIDEYCFFLYNNIWEAIHQDDEFLCIGCVEERLGRKLNQCDFNFDVPLNRFDGSHRLNQRKLAH